jgi:hypothetical protein
MNRRIILSVLCLAGLSAPAWCADPQTPAASEQTTGATAADLEALKQKIAAQQEQIKKLQAAMDEQQKLLEQSLQNMQAEAARTTTKNGTPVVEASTSTQAGPVRLVPALSGGPNSRAYAGQPSGNAQNPCESDDASPTYIRIGNVCVVPIGFMDLTGLWRNVNAASSIGTNFGSIPLNSNINAKNSEFRFSPQNSRIGFRIDGDWKGTHFIGYNEFDFLGTSGATNLTVTNGAFVPRLRLFWVDVRKGKIEFLGGQSWSMLTPNRSGISALPGDIFYSQVMDVNYMAGLTWTRQPGVRVLVHPSEKVTFGVSFENPDQYMGGANGSSAALLPTALTGLATTQLDNGGSISGTSTVLSTPTVMPDIIAKLAFDPTSRFHFEVAGITSQFKVFNNATTGPGINQHYSTTGAGLQVGLNGAITKNFRLITTNFWDDGEGRYLFGQAPDVILRANGALSAVHSAGTVDGFEAMMKNTLLFGYYGGIFIGRDVALDANGTSKVGYGYSGSSQNRDIQEITFGFNQTMWKNPRYGALSLIGQYEWADRSLWYWTTGIAGGKGAHDNTIYMDVRYTLPGSMPKF